MVRWSGTAWVDCGPLERGCAREKFNSERGRGTVGEAWWAFKGWAGLDGGGAWERSMVRFASRQRPFGRSGTFCTSDEGAEPRERPRRGGMDGKEAKVWEAGGTTVGSKGVRPSLG